MQMDLSTRDWFFYFLFVLRFMLPLDVHLFFNFRFFLCLLVLQLDVSLWTYSIISNMLCLVPCSSLCILDNWFFAFWGLAVCVCVVFWFAWMVSYLCITKILKKSPMILFRWLFNLQSATGWFSFHTVDCLRRCIDVRFMSVCPHPRAESLLNSMSARFEKAKRNHNFVKVARSEEQEKVNKGLKQSIYL